MTIGARLKALRLKKDVTLEEVSKAVGVARQTYFRYETGEIINIPLRAIEKMAVYFAVSPAYLCGWAELKPVNLTKEEYKVIESFRKLDAVSQEMVSDLIESRLARLNKQALAEESEFSA